SHPPRAGVDDGRCSVLQRRRLGRKLHDAYRRFQRSAILVELVRSATIHPSSRSSSTARSSSLNIAIVTDAWKPQTNGVVQTLGKTVDALREMQHDVCVIEPGLFRTFPCPTYPEIRLSLMPYPSLARKLDAFAPDAVHIATEGPLGNAARRWC